MAAAALHASALHSAAHAGNVGIIKAGGETDLRALGACADRYALSLAHGVGGIDDAGKALGGSEAEAGAVIYGDRGAGRAAQAV